MKSSTLFLAGCLALLALPARADDKDVGTRAASIRQTACQTCHGPDGNSGDPKVPRLNGQIAPYIFARLHSMRYPVREAPRAIHNMGGVAPELETKVVAAIANYYAAQRPMEAGPARGSLAREGERIYKNGAGPVPACQACHGAQGQGGDKAPRLAGQHGEYLVLAMQAFAMGIRVSEPMNRHVWQMPTEQMKAVAAYLGGNRD
jgi:cytochrome c553